MWDQITKTLFLCCIGIWLVCFGLFAYGFIGIDRLLQAFYYYEAILFNTAGMTHQFSVSANGGLLHRSVAEILSNPYYEQNIAYCIERLSSVALIASVIAVIVGGLLAYYFIRQGRVQTAHQFIRGSCFKEAKDVKKLTLKKGVQSDITIDDFPLIHQSEVQHLLVHGTVGTGKSQLIMKILDALRQRGDRVIIYDKGCAFIPSYFREATDNILNPFDTRCPNWDLWHEAPRDSDLENMAESLIPISNDADPFWVNAARMVFVQVAARMRGEPNRSIEALLDLLLNSDFKTLEAYLTGTPAATLISSKIEKTAISIRSVITTYLKSLQTLSGLNKVNSPSFSIRDYLLDPNAKGWLFISSNGEHHKTLKPLMSMWLAMSSLTLLSLTPDDARRIWFICDELPTLHRLPMLGETIAEVRKFGGCFLLGMQSASQLEKIYGRSGAAEIFDLLNTRFFFRSPSSEMARLVSSELGEEDCDESRENYSYGANSVRDGISLGTQRVARPIISYPEILELPNLTCFVRLPGEYPVTQLKLKYSKRTCCAAPLLLRDIPSSLSEIQPVEKPIPEEQRKGFMPTHSKERVNEYMD